MLRILLVLDDYNEMVFLQTVLKKLGFDVDGIQNPRKLEETLLVFNPQVVLATVRGKRVDGVALIPEVMKRTPSPRMLLLRSAGVTLPEDLLELKGVDHIVDSPVNIRQLLTVLATYSDIDVEALLERYQKMQKQEAGGEEGDLLRELGESLGIPMVEDRPEPEPEDEAAQVVRVPQKQSSLSDSERNIRYQKALEEVATTPKAVFDPTRVRADNKALRSQENIDELADLEEERKAFVKSLFAEGKKN